MFPPLCCLFPPLPTRYLVGALEGLEVKKRDERDLDDGAQAAHGQVVEVRGQAEEDEKDGQAGGDVAERGAGPVLGVEGGAAEGAGAGEAEEEASHEIGGADRHLVPRGRGVRARMRSRKMTALET